MAEGSFFSWLFGEENREQKNSEPVTNVPQNEVALQDVIGFVTEIQSYYYNDICKMQTDIAMCSNPNSNEIKFLEKKLKQDSSALAQIDKLLESIKKEEREYLSVGRKSVYSFYDELEQGKLQEVKAKVFEIVVKLCTINTKPELYSVITKRLEAYKEAWNIGPNVVPAESFSPILLSLDGQIENYRIGRFNKQVISASDEYELTSNQLEKLLNMRLIFESVIKEESVWVHVSGVTRAGLNLMRKTCLTENCWEYNPSKKLIFDVVKLTELEQYLKGVLQIVLARRKYAVISIFVPTNEMLRAIGPVKYDGTKVEICKRFLFIYRERSRMYGENLQTARINRLHIPEELDFMSYSKFRKLNF